MTIRHYPQMPTTRRHPRTMAEAFSDADRAQWITGPYRGGDHWGWWAASVALIGAVLWPIVRGGL